VDFLGRELALTGTHVRFVHGVCGACTMLYDGLPACLLFAPQANGHEIVTVEGLARPAAGCTRSRRFSCVMMQSPVDQLPSLGSLAPLVSKIGLAPVYFCAPAATRC
jgi:hypothetical protein